jgi:hypothetical protein
MEEEAKGTGEKVEGEEGEERRREAKEEEEERLSRFGAMSEVRLTVTGERWRGRGGMAQGVGCVLQGSQVGSQAKKRVGGSEGSEGPLG